MLKKCGTSKTPCNPQPKQKKNKEEEKWTNRKLHYLMRTDYWIGRKLPWKAGRAGYVQSIKRNNFTKFIYQLTYSSCDAVCIVAVNSEEDSGEDGCWVGCWQYLPWLTLVGENSGMKTVLSGLLLAQWLRLWAPDAGDPDSVPGQESRSHIGN